MNSVTLIGRLTRDPDVKYTQQQMAIARFSIAIDRGKGKNGEDKGADFPNIVCFGKTAEMVEKWLGKGRLVGIVGRIHTDSYEKDGKKVYTTDIAADRVEFLDKASSSEQAAPSSDAPEGFSRLQDDDLPF